jgi:flagellar biosynthesis protein FlhG
MKAPIIVSVGSGKGGVGKSTIVANIGAVLAGKGRKIGFIDADLEGANLHLCLGVRRPAHNLQDYLTGRAQTLSDVAVPTIVSGSWLVSGASDILQLANPHFSQKQRIISNLRKLDADYLLVDLGAGTDNNVVDFHAAFPNAIVVTDCLPASIETAYGFLKNGVARGFARLFPGRPEIREYVHRFADARSKSGFATVTEFLASFHRQFAPEARQMREWLATRKIFLTLNMIKTQDEVTIGMRFIEMVKKYLSVKLYYMGYVVYTPDIRKSLKHMKPAVLDNPAPQTLQCFESLAQNLEDLTRE